MDALGDRRPVLTTGAPRLRGSRTAAWVALTTLTIACVSASSAPHTTLPKGLALNTGLPPIDVRYGIDENDIELGILLAIARNDTPPQIRPGQPITDAMLRRIVGPATPAPTPEHVWYFDSRRPGLVFAGYEERSIKMRVAIRYDDQMVLLRIVESQNLGQTGDHIDAKALRLLADLDRKIRRSVIAIAQRNRYGSPLPANLSH